jgi:arylsulfatase A-like enzyme
MKESAPLLKHLKASVFLGTVGGTILGALETIIVILHYRGGPVAFREIGPTVLAAPLLLYALVSVTGSLLIGFILGILFGNILGVCRKTDSVIRLYAVLLYLPLVLFAAFLWWTRVLVDEPFLSGRSLFHLFIFFFAGYIVFRIVRALISFAMHKRATLITRILIVLILLIIALTMKGVWSIRRDRGGEFLTVSKEVDLPLNVLLITMDTQRADYLGCYGDSLMTTPHLDELAAGGTIFLEASAQVPMTLPSHMSIFTSTYPVVHGVRTNSEPRKLPGTMRTMTEIFRERGYRTGAFVSSFVLHSSFTETSRGFDVYDDQFEDNEMRFLARIKPRPSLVHVMEWLGFTLSKRLERQAGDTSTRAIQWLDQVADWAPFFLWIHYYDPHSYYDPPAPFDTLYIQEIADRERVGILMETARNYFPKQGDHVELNGEELQAVRALYRGEVSYMDHHIGRVIDHLRETGRLGRTLIVATADHGETLGEHDTLGHSPWIYQPIIHIPLFFWNPGRVPAGAVREDVVESVDIMPTILELVGIPAPEQIQGKSLVPLFTADETPVFTAYFETFKSEEPERRSVGIRLGPWKYIFEPWGVGEYLFHLERDPDESINLVAEEPELAARLRDQASAIMSDSSTEEAAEAIELTPESIEALRALGYIK